MMAKRFFLYLVSCYGILCVCGGIVAASGHEHAAGHDIHVDFDDSIVMPLGLVAETTGYVFHTATWQVVKDKAALSPPNILKITKINHHNGGVFNICWTDDVHMTDGTITVDVRADSGRIDQGGGPIWRVRDRNNYYVARLNPLEDNFRVYFVKDGRRRMIASADIHGIRQGNWFRIKITMQGESITGWVNGKKLIEVNDSTFNKGGGVGLWTKADAASSFDDFNIKIDK
jgi:hypothetical protein